MRRKSTKKGDRKNKKQGKGTKASTKKKKNKAGSKKRNTGKATKKRSRKLQILSAGSASSPYAEPTEPEPKKPKKSRKPKDKCEETAAAKKASPKAKAAAKRATPKTKAAAKKAAAKPKAKGEPKARAKRSRKTAVDALLESPFRHNELISELKEWVEWFGPEYDPPDQKNKFKAAVRESLFPLTKTFLNIYWSRCGCGVKNSCDSHAAYKAKDWCNFGFNQGLAPQRWKMAMAVRCAEMVVSKQRI